MLWYRGSLWCQIVFKINKDTIALSIFNQPIVGSRRLGFEISLSDFFLRFTISYIYLNPINESKKPTLYSYVSFLFLFSLQGICEKKCMKYAKYRKLRNKAYFSTPQLVSCEASLVRHFYRKSLPFFFPKRPIYPKSFKILASIF